MTSSGAATHITEKQESDGKIRVSLVISMLLVFNFDATGRAVPSMMSSSSNIGGGLGGGER